MRSICIVGWLLFVMTGCSEQPGPVWVDVRDYMAIGRDGLSVSEAKERFIVTGGNLEVAGSTNFAEEFDPGTGKWQPLPDIRGIMTSCGETQRRDHRATVLPDGRILITGGVYSMSAKSTEGCACAFNESECITAYSDSFVLFDPDEHRLNTCANELASNNGQTCTQPSIREWSAGWSSHFKLEKRHAMHTVTLLENGTNEVDVLLLGGSGEDIKETLEALRYEMNACQQSWESSLLEKIDNTGQGLVTGHTAIPFGNLTGPTSRILVLGGVVLSSTDNEDVENGKVITENHAHILEYYTGGASKWIAAPANGPGPRVGHIAVYLDQQRVLIAGGWDEARKPLQDAWIFETDADGQQGHFRAIAPMKRKHAFAAVSQWEKSVYVSGGYDGSLGPSRTVERFDAKSETWSEIPPMNSPRAKHGMTPLTQTGSVFLVTGGVEKLGGDSLPTGELLYLNGECGGGDIWMNECSPGLVCDLDEGRCVVSE